MSAIASPRRLCQTWLTAPQRPMTSVFQNPVSAAAPADRGAGSSALAQPVAAARRSDSLATPSISPLIACLIAATTTGPTTGTVGCVRTA